MRRIKMLLLALVIGLSGFLVGSLDPAAPLLAAQSDGESTDECKDEDDDSLCDKWERNGGIDVIPEDDGDDTKYEVPLPNAEVGMKDLYVEVDYIQGNKPVGGIIEAVNNGNGDVKDGVMGDSCNDKEDNGSPKDNDGDGMANHDDPDCSVIKAFADKDISLHVIIDQEISSVDQKKPIKFVGEKAGMNIVNNGFYDFKLGNPAGAKRNLSTACKDGHLGIKLGSNPNRPQEYDDPADCRKILTYHKKVYRYALFAHKAPKDSFLGIAELKTSDNGANDIMITINASWMDLRKANERVGADFSGMSDTEILGLFHAQVFIHELGHTLGFGHGGLTKEGKPDNDNCKPNYPSIMNYWVAMYYPALFGNSKGKFRIAPPDYSSKKAKPDTLNEKELNEKAGLKTPLKFVMYAGKDGEPSIQSREKAIKGINWDSENGSDEKSAKANINKINTFADCKESKENEKLNDHDDWGNLHKHSQRLFDPSDESDIAAKDDIPDNPLSSTEVRDTSKNWVEPRIPGVPDEPPGFSPGQSFRTTGGLCEINISGADACNEEDATGPPKDDRQNSQLHIIQTLNAVPAPLVVNLRYAIPEHTSYVGGSLATRGAIEDDLRFDAEREEIRGTLTLDPSSEAAISLALEVDDNAQPGRKISTCLTVSGDDIFTAEDCGLLAKVVEAVPPCPFLEENFNNAEESDWPTPRSQTDNFVTGFTNNGEFKMIRRGLPGILGATAPTGGPVALSNCFIEFDVKQVVNDTYNSYVDVGLDMSLTGGQGVSFTINAPDQTFSVIERVFNDRTPIVPRTKFNVIKTEGFNHVRIQAQNRQTQLFINDSLAADNLQLGTFQPAIFNLGLGLIQAQGEVQLAVRPNGRRPDDAELNTKTLFDNFKMGPPVAPRVEVRTNELTFEGTQESLFGACQAIELSVQNPDELNSRAIEIGLQADRDFLFFPNEVVTLTRQDLLQNRTASVEVCVDSTNLSASRHEATVSLTAQTPDGDHIGVTNGVVPVTVIVTSL